MYPSEAEIRADVRRALDEDIGRGDLTARLISPDTSATATVISREPAILCGVEWFDGVFSSLDQDISIKWQVGDGDRIDEGQILCILEGPARPMLTGERTALNFLQTLSGTATLANRYAEAVTGTGVKVLDTRKTLPGLRMAQKYAVSTGGCYNHRIGLFDAILIKENHIVSAGSIHTAVAAARNVAAGVLVEVEVENLDELEEALTANVDRVLLDNFTTENLRKAVELTGHRAELEASGNVNLENIRELAQTGVDYISVGALTKDVRAIDLSMRFELWD
jgi:nicotinate-nucleotide pyrophosphorylase (carboxylating)